MRTDQAGPGRVVVGIDGSLGGYQALRYAAFEARRRDAALIAARIYWNSPGSHDLIDASLLAEGAAAQVHQAFAAALGGFPPDITIHVAVRNGIVAPCLVVIANRDEDLLVIGGGTPGRLRFLHRATTARFCSLHAACPVVIVPPTAWARDHDVGQLGRDTAREAEDFLETDRHADPS